jgi:hypothetical protein
MGITQCDRGGSITSSMPARWSMPEIGSCCTHESEGGAVRFKSPHADGVVRAVVAANDPMAGVQIRPPAVAVAEFRRRASFQPPPLRRWSWLGPVLVIVLGIAGGIAWSVAFLAVQP